MDILADTSFVYAVVEPRDQAHRQARAFYLAVSDRILYPTVALPELAFLANRLGGSPAVVAAVRAVRHSAVVLTDPDSEDYDRAAEILAKYSDSRIDFVDAYISAAIAARLWLECAIRLMTLPRRNQKAQLPAAVCALFNAVRQIIETVNGQLTEQFNIETNHAHTFEGLCARLYSKLTAHTLCIYINRLLGKANFLQIKSLAFPI